MSGAGSKMVGVFVGIMLVSVAISAFSAAVGMLLLDVIHNEISVVPELSFITTWALFFLTASVASVCRGASVKMDTK